MVRSEDSANVARCGSTWVFLVGTTVGFLTLSIDWIWDRPNDARTGEAIAFGTLSLCLYVPFSLLVSHGTNKSSPALLKGGIFYGFLSNLFSMIAFGYWVWWTVDAHVSSVSRPKKVKDIAIATTVFYFIAMCTFGGTLGAAANLVRSLEASSQLMNEGSSFPINNDEAKV